MLEHEKAKFGIEGDATMAFGPTARAVAPGQRRQRQGRALPDEEEQDHRVRRLGHASPTPTTLEVEQGRRDDVYTFDNLHHRGRRDRAAAARHGGQRERRDLRGADPRRGAARARSSSAASGAIGVEFAYVMHNFGVEVTIVEFLDRMVPTGGRRRLQGAAQALQEARRRGADSRPRSRTSRTPAPASRSRVTPCPTGGEQQVLEADKVLQAIGFAAARRGLRPGEHRRRASPSAARSRSTAACRTNVPHVYAIGDVTGEADAGARRRGDGHRRGRDHRRRRDHAELDYDMIPRATYCQPQIGIVRLHRGAGQGEGLRRQGRQFPFSANGKAHGSRRRGRLRQGRRRRASTTRSSAPT